jgi:hypothetical protein
LEPGWNNFRAAVTVTGVCAWSDLTMKQLDLVNQCPDMRDGLQARVHDPLLLLARQWQTGEFKADDAGSPVGAYLSVENTAVSRYRLGAATNPARDYLKDKLPLETLVERESIVPAEGKHLRTAVQSGQHFVRLLNGAGLARYVPALLNAFKLQLPTPTQRASLDNDTLSYLGVMATRVIDGIALYNKLVPGHQASGQIVLPTDAPFNTVVAADQPAMIGVVGDWLTWHETLFSQPSGNESAWIKERMEYTFAVSGATTKGELALNAPEYHDGTLDWFSFDVDTTQTLGAGVQAAITSSTFLPSPVTFRGMPSNRFWELEDGSVNFANIEAAPQDLARALLVTFALEFGNDWFLVPVETPVGSLSAIRALVVTNTFGEKLLLRHTTAVDGATPAWRMFGLSSSQGSDVATAAKFTDVFFLPPVLGPSLEADPVEDVLLLRDEMASMAWAVERTVESPGGRRLDRYENTVQKSQPAATGGTATGSQPGALKRFVYRMGTSVPDYWIPFLPVQTGPAVQLRRGSLPGIQPGSMIQPLGRLLVPGQDLLLHDEEVPREGARVTRSYQYARWSDGSTHVWVGRRKEPGRGEGSSSLQFDIIDSHS